MDFVDFLTAFGPTTTIAAFAIVVTVLTSSKRMFRLDAQDHTVSLRVAVTEDPKCFCASVEIFNADKIPEFWEMNRVDGSTYRIYKGGADANPSDLRETAIMLAATNTYRRALNLGYNIEIILPSGHTYADGEIKT